MRIIDPVAQARDREAQRRRFSEVEASDLELAEAVNRLRVARRVHGRAERVTCPCHPEPELSEAELFDAYRNARRED